MGVIVWHTEGFPVLWIRCHDTWVTWTSKGSLWLVEFSFEHGVLEWYQQSLQGFALEVAFIPMSLSFCLYPTLQLGPSKPDGVRYLVKGCQ